MTINGQKAQAFLQDRCGIVTGDPAIPETSPSI
jgi:hypothetical protein